MVLKRIAWPKKLSNLKKKFEKYSPDNQKLKAIISFMILKNFAIPKRQMSTFMKI